jgi:phytoene dehydrogenase-like protein
MSRAAALEFRSSRPITAAVFRAICLELAQSWRTLKKDLRDPYRPELRYMRGPGPRWREKHTAPLI